MTIPEYDSGVVPSRSPEEMRQARLEALADMITLALGPDFGFVILIGKADDPDSVNLLSNCPPEFTNQLFKVIQERQARGIGPREL